MTPELDALLIRSLPEIDAAAMRLNDLSTAIGKEIDAEIGAWLINNGWKGEADLFGDSGETWLAPEEWRIPGEGEERFFLNFGMDETGAEPENYWHVSSLTGCGQQRLGFWLYYDGVGKGVYNRLWRDQKNTAGLPLLGTEFFLPIELDGETLAVAIENGMITDALQPLRDTLDRLPQIASQFGPLKQAIATAAAPAT